MRETILWVLLWLGLGYCLFVVFVALVLWLRN